ncbi:OmpA family protein [Cyanobacterium sp. Dongsha4]|uniref:OmpA/MotB family protein n=1 Tax=Cyanobacterium sp. DS4 TaxID=2878255 RepID=UPI002E823D33|nr:OmpA family protein [Cyanobacterium sp. Dongsha4]WVL00699.1 OmpA family protein [Cyanobacterium sp. Dongsha4]
MFNNLFESETDEELLEEQDSGVWLSVGDLMSGLLMFFALLFIAVSAQLVEYDNVIKKIPLAIIEATKNIEGVGDSIKVDPNGDLSLDDKILFDEGKATLKPEGKQFLKLFIPVYSQTIFTDEIFDEQVSRIIIEGHTSSKGEEKDNMELSFQRALAVIEYINTIEFPEKNQFKKKLLAAGRGEIDAEKSFDNPQDRKVMFRFQFKREDLTTIFQNKIKQNKEQ